MILTALLALVSSCYMISGGLVFQRVLYKPNHKKRLILQQNFLNARMRSINGTFLRIVCNLKMNAIFASLSRKSAGYWLNVFLRHHVKVSLPIDMKHCFAPCCETIEYQRKYHSADIWTTIWLITSPFQNTLKRQPYQFCKILSVSYTHLTLPTNREV